MNRPSFTEPNWFQYAGDEHKAARTSAVLIDETSLAKMEIFGPDAFEAVQMMWMDQMGL